MKKIFSLLAVLASSLSLTSCKSYDGEPNMDHPVSLFDYVLDLGTITDYDESKMLEFCKENFVPSGGKCTCVVTQVDGKNLVGRNTDVMVSKNPIMKFVLDINKYKTLGLGYPLFERHMNYKRLLRRGFNDYGKMAIPLIGTDYLNEKGLYIETNMRSEEANHEITGTNELSDTDVYVMCFPAYASTRCANVEEAVELANNLNIYNNLDPKKGITWNFGFTLADAEGNYGVLEIANNKVSWLPKQNGQANFYITEEFAKDTKYQSGESRFETANKGLDEVKTLDNMLKHMEKVYYSQTNRPSGLRDLPFDMRSEYTECYPVNDKGEFDPKHGSIENCTTDWLTNEETKEQMFDLMEDDNDKCYSKYLNDDGTWNINKIRKHWIGAEFWMTMFSTAVDCNEKTMKVRFYEDANQQLEFSI